MMLMVCLHVSEAQKGGAKAGMRRGGKGGRGGGRGGVGGGARADDAGAGDWESGRREGAGGRGRPCVGICYLRLSSKFNIFLNRKKYFSRKLRGQKPLKMPKRSKPCVGMCYRKKLEALKKKSSQQS